MAKFRTGDLSAIFSEMSRCFKQNAKGDTVFEGFHFGDIATVLETFAEFSDDLPTSLRRSLTTQAMWDTARSGDISQKRFQSALKALESKYLKNQPSTFYLLTTISAALPQHGYAFSLLSQPIRFGSSIPRRLTRSGLEFPKQLLERENAARRFAKVCLTVQARCRFDALQKALFRIDLLRSVWNFHLNFGWTRLSAGSPTQPVNKVILGPIHTIHDPAGHTEKPFWYEPFFPDHLPFKQFDAAGFAALKRYQQDILRALRRVKYGSLLQDALVRYCRALDLADSEASYLKLWSIIELLTNTVGDRYEETVKRTAFLFPNNAYHRQIMEHLRDKRNSSVHHGEFPELAQGLLFQIKYYAEALLYFHLFNRYRFSSLDEAAAFLALSPDIAALANRALRTRQAIVYRRRGRHAKKVSA